MNARLVVATVLWVVGATPATMMPATANAQTPEATISGVVTDATGGALPGVTVMAVHDQTGQRSATTNAEGFYALRSLPIGPYVVEAGLSGFQRYRREGLTLTTGATVPLDIRLPIGELTDTVTVRAEAPMLGARAHLRRAELRHRLGCVRRSYDSAGSAGGVLSCGQRDMS
jgi:hypothetical protein